MSLLKGKTSAAEAARKHGLTVGQVEEWREVFLLGAGFRSLKEECVWVNRFADFAAAQRAIAAWIAWYNAERPHQALGYLSPAAFRATPAAHRSSSTGALGQTCAARAAASGCWSAPSPPQTARDSTTLPSTHRKIMTSQTVSGRPFDAPARCPRCSGGLVNHWQVSTCFACGRQYEEPSTAAAAPEPAIRPRRRRRIG